MKKIKARLLVGFLGCMSLFLTALAADKLPFNDNQTLSVQLSQNNINKLFIEGDPVVDFHAPANYLVFSDPEEITDRDGALYVQLATTHPFTMYVSTEQRHHVGLTITPIKSLGRTVELIPKTASPIAREWEDRKGYESSVIALMKALMRNKKPQGFGLQEAAGPRTLYVYETGKLTSKLIYQGNHLRGIVFELCNEGSETLTLREEDFMREGVKGVALSRYVVEPNTNAFVYEVTGN